ncbi:MAG: hypothetical protein R2729_31160 [Bryobacteraceae bacterium]
MGLNERRKIHELRDTVLPEREREITEISGATVPYDVDWASFGEDAEALKFLDNVSCHRLNMALRVICMDAMGREAVQASLKKVRLVNVSGPAEMGMSFGDGILEMRCAYALGAQGMHSDGAIRQLLEQSL